LERLADDSVGNVNNLHLIKCEIFLVVAHDFSLAERIRLVSVSGLPSIWVCFPALSAVSRRRLTGPAIYTGAQRPVASDNERIERIAGRIATDDKFLRTVELVLKPRATAPAGLI
jgi:hypothetical protein